MSFLAPLFIYAGLAVAAATVALHCIVTRQPPSVALPTARFVPEATVRVTTVAPPENRRLLLLRILLVLLTAAAFARPVITPRRRPVVRVVLADVSRAVARIGDVRDSVRALLRPGDALVVFDTAARVIDGRPADSAAVLPQSTGVARLSPALVAGLRLATELRRRADSLELVIVSPLRASATDGATAALRALWPGRARVVRVAATDGAAPPAGVSVRAPVGDPLVAGVVAAQLPPGDSAVRIVRGDATAADSAWAASGRRTLVRWPVTGPPPGWEPRQRADTSPAVIAGEAAMVAPLLRRWRPRSAGAPGRVAARWVDGEPAAIERVVGSGCIRDVAITLPTRGDLPFRPAFGDVLRVIAAPCATIAAGPPMSDADVQLLVGGGPLAAASAIAPAERRTTPLVPWLLASALLVALAELFVRGPGRARRRATPFAVEREAA